MRNELLISLLLIFHFSFFTSCIIDKDEIKFTEENEGELLLRVQVPGQSLPSTRASSFDESHIETLDVLVFKEEAAGETFAYRRPAIQREGTTFSVSLQLSEDSEKYRFVLLANLRDEILTEIEKSSFEKGDRKEDVLQKIVFEGKDPWDITSPRYLPLWGESKKTHEVTTDLSASMVETISLIRSVVRLDVGVNFTSDDEGPEGGEHPWGKFLITEVRVYNTSAKGYAAPAEGNFDPTGGESGKGIATAATAFPETTQQYISYTHEATDGNGFYQEIYLPETAASAGHTILVRGYYARWKQNFTDQTWYRIDLYDHSEKTPTGTLTDLLRNHRYRVNIIEVKDHGYTNATDALANVSENVTAELMVYDEQGEINHIVYNNLYLLGVEKVDYSFPGEENNGIKLPVLTTYEYGWNYIITDSPETGAGNPVTWLQNVSKIEKGVGQTEYLTFDMEPWGVKRRAYVHLQAGRLKEVICITQQGLPNCYIVKPGGTLDFLVSKAYAVWADDGMGDQKKELTGTISCNIIWQDAPNLLSVNLATSGNQGVRDKLQVTANGSEGNALVGIYMNGESLPRYSWHIWVTNYEPDANQPGHNNGQQTYIFMDRNLGALTNTKKTLTTHGFFYQWGRKDPFPGPDVIEQTSFIYNTHKALFDRNNVPKIITLEQAPLTAASKASNNLHHALQHPDYYYYNAITTYPGDWYTTQTDAMYQSQFLWSDKEEMKGTFDPCPQGWRVPAYSKKVLRSPWWTVDNSENTWEPGNYGNIWDMGWIFTSVNFGGYYPAAGYRNNEDGLFRFVGSNGYNWAASSAGQSSYSLVTRSSHLIPSLGVPRSSGYSVRCVADQ